MAPYEQENIRFQIEDFSKTSFGSDNEDAKLQSPERSCGRRSRKPTVKKGEKPAWIGRWENAASGQQLDNVRQEIHVFYAMIQHLETDAIRDKKDNRPLLHQKRRQRLTGRYPQKVQAADERALLGQGEKFRAEISIRESARAM